MLTMGRQYHAWPGQTRTFNCTANGLPEPDITWFRGHEYLRANETYMIVGKRRSSILQVNLSEPILLHVLCCAVNLYAMLLCIHLWHCWETIVKFLNDAEISIPKPATYDKISHLLVEEARVWRLFVKPRSAISPLETFQLLLLRFLFCWVAFIFEGCLFYLKRLTTWTHHRYWERISNYIHLVSGL